MTGWPITLVAAAVLGGGLLVERLLLAARFTPYFTAGFPLLPELVPIPAVPKREEGTTASVRWVRDGAIVRFSAHGRGGPMGLHGAVLLRPVRRGGVAMDVRWAPPWTPLLAATWLGGLATARGEPYMLPVAVGLGFVVLHVYRTAAVKAAAELRWAFVSGLDTAGD